MTRPTSPSVFRPGETRGILEQKLAAYRRFLSITETLQQKIAAGDMEEAGKLIAWRQDCIGWIDALDGRLNSPEQASSSANAALEAMKTEMDEILKRILRLDEDMIGALAGFRDEMQNRLSGLTARKHSFGGYRPGGGRSAGMLSVQT